MAPVFSLNIASERDPHTDQKYNIYLLQEHHFWVEFTPFHENFSIALLLYQTIGHYLALRRQANIKETFQSPVGIKIEHSCLKREN